MITTCYSYDGECPCINCDKRCCIDLEHNGMIDTEKLCDKAKEHCEKCTQEAESWENGEK